MAWERRPSGRYFYTSCRDANGHVKKRYYGRGAVAHRAAGLLAEAKAQREAERQSLLAEQARLRPADQLVALLIDGAELLMSAALLAAGFHHPRQGGWRKRRAGRTIPS
jgi:hypothetical protein